MAEKPQRIIKIYANPSIAIIQELLLQEDKNDYVLASERVVRYKMIEVEYNNWVPSSITIYISPHSYVVYRASKDRKLEYSFLIE